MSQNPTACFKTRVVILGAGRMGQALPAVLDIPTENVTFIDIRFNRSMSGCRARLIESDVCALVCDAQAAVAAASCIVLALPATAAAAAFEQLLPHVAPKAILVETLSVKAPIAQWRNRDTFDNELLGLNPMFGPDLDWRHRPLAAVQHRSGLLTKQLLNQLEAIGCKVVTFSSDDHDRWMAYRQGAAHALLLAMGQVLANSTLQAGPENAAGADLLTGPPPYQTLILLLARMLEGSPETYAEIQTLNPYAAQVRHELSTALAEMDVLEPKLRQDIQALAGHLSYALAPAAEACAALFSDPIIPTGPES